MASAEGEGGKCRGEARLQRGWKWMSPFKLGLRGMIYEPGKGALQTFQIPPERPPRPNAFPASLGSGRGGPGGRVPTLWGGGMEERSVEILSSHPDVRLYFENKN